MRIAVASPFVDKKHGTERALAELLERLAQKHGCEIDLYAQRVEDLHVVPDSETNSASGAIRWCRVPSFPGPHLLKFLWWYHINRIWRWRRTRQQKYSYDVVFSPGINAGDANFILVHAVFHRLAEMQTTSNFAGIRGLHRSLYYRLLRALERSIYGDLSRTVVAVSQHTAAQLDHFFHRTSVSVVPNGVDSGLFSAKLVAPLRATARQELGISASETVILLIGNDWKNKGLPTLLEALSLSGLSELRLLVVGQDDSQPFLELADQHNVRQRIIFTEPRSDVRYFYAAADVLTAPSLEDSFNLPVLEAMSSGLPVIVSRNAGISEWLQNGKNAILLENAEDANELAAALRQVMADPSLRQSLIENARATALALSWDKHAAEIFRLLQQKIATGSRA